MAIGNHNNRTWFDRGALRYMRNQYGVDTLVDIGCGTKIQVKTALSIGLLLLLFGPIEIILIIILDSGILISLNLGDLNMMMISIRKL